ncbi:hypothetical protein MPSEU_000437000 [Mayamaea pseudoterrestris]|nr:hypothetical protein MPSEU_000437000 [Mayamaea pseudoterrestris]
MDQRNNSNNIVDDSSVSDIYTTDGANKDEFRIDQEDTMKQMKYLLDSTLLVRRNDDEDLGEVSDMNDIDNDSNASVLSDNALFRAEVEAEERKIMAEYNLGPDFERAVSKAAPASPPAARPIHRIRPSASEEEKSMRAVSESSSVEVEDLLAGGGAEASEAGSSFVATPAPSVRAQRYNEENMHTPVKMSLARKASKEDDEVLGPEDEQSLPSQLLDAGLAKRLQVLSQEPLLASKAVSPDRTEKTFVEQSPERTFKDPESQQYIHEGNRPPSMIIIGGPSGNNEEKAAKPLGDEEERPKSCFRRMTEDKLGRLVLVLLFILLVAVAVAVFSLVKYGKNGQLMSSTSKEDTAPNLNSTNNVTEFPAFADESLQPTIYVTESPTKSPIEEQKKPAAQRTDSPTSLPKLARTDSPTDQPTDQPTAESTDQPTDAPTYSPSLLATNEPTVPPVAAARTDSPTVSECVDDASATIYVNDRFGDQSCSWLSDKPGQTKRLCAGRAKDVCCATCSGAAETTSVQAPTTSSPTKAPVQAPHTSAPTALQAPMPKPTRKPSPAPAVPVTQEPMLETGEPTAAFPSVLDSPTQANAGDAGGAAEVQNSASGMITGIANDKTRAAIATPGSPQAKSLQWVEDNLSSQEEHKIKQAFGLATLAYMTNHQNWKDNEGWLNGGTDICSWAGVNCDSGAVTKIDLSGNGVEGKLPGELSYVGFLTHLNLSDNSLKGRLPKPLGSLSSLQSLQLQNNNFSGPIPPGYSKLSQLSELYLWHNNLTGTLSSEICELPNLTDVNVDCREVEAECWTTCYYLCGEDSGVTCDDNFEP